MVRSKLQFRSGAYSDVGVVRESNQDSAFFAPNLLLLADGMGGHAGGDVASTIATTVLASLDNLANPRGFLGSRLSLKDATDLIDRSIVQVYLAILEAAKNNPELAGMGTTLTGVLRADSTYILFHIGDSRCYRLHNGELTQVTKDHTLVQHLLDSGKINQMEADNHPNRNVVIRVLGDFESNLTPDYDYFPITEGDRYFLCSDGVCGSLSHDEMREILISESDPENAARILVDRAIAAGSTDNCTAVVSDVLPKVNDTNIAQAIYVGAAREALQKHLNSVASDAVANSTEIAVNDDSPKISTKKSKKKSNTVKQNQETVKQNQETVKQNQETDDNAQSKNFLSKVRSLFK